MACLHLVAELLRVVGLPAVSAATAELLQSVLTRRVHLVHLRRHRKISRLVLSWNLAGLRELVFLFP